MQGRTGKHKPEISPKNSRYKRSSVGAIKTCKRRPKKTPFPIEQAMGQVRPAVKKKCVHPNEPPFPVFQNGKKVFFFPFRRSQIGRRPCVVPYAVCGSKDDRRGI